MGVWVMQVVWFKRDLRVHDHVPLVEASRRGRCLCLYVYEPEIMESPEFDTSHLNFINQSLAELDRQLTELGGRLIRRVGAMPDVLDQLHHEHGIDALWSHEETGNLITYKRDLRVAKWTQLHGIPWHEFPQNGVVRRLKSRDGWSRLRDTFMKRPVAPAPRSIDVPNDIKSQDVQEPASLGLPASEKTELPVGGEHQGRVVLESFLASRGENYSFEMSSPVTAWDSCSRLSPYLAWGCLSIRDVAHAVRDRRAELKSEKQAGGETGAWLRSLKAYESRLSWHCHFIQKLEDEPAIEFENMSRAYDGLREDEFSQSHFDAWCSGQTGYPMVDACMRALHQHSWINFRMRAMLVSFASYHLWLHWRPTAVYLARHFLDFEPGIHFSQFQMQSGTAGINTIRIYSPVKQVQDHDPDGQFIRKFVPELACVPREFIAEPHKMPLSTQSLVGCRIGKDYPKPIVENAKAYKTARERMYAIRGKSETRQDARRVMQRHGSRKSWRRR